MSASGPAPPAAADAAMDESPFPPRTAPTGALDVADEEFAPEAEAAAGTAAAAAGQAVRALAHVARSFVLYDAANERIRGFLEDVRAKVERFIATYGEMRLEVRPWEIALGGEVVYSEHDRERSLAFRLYRDGVRRITLKAGLAWEELIVLIGILSVRYKGVRTQEDDVVTLLWRAEFTHIEVGAVEGLVASDDDPADAGTLPAGAAAGARDALQAMVWAAPYAFNYPWPEWSERAPVERRPVPPALLARIVAEDGAGALPGECLQLARELVSALADPHDPLAPGDAAPVLYELRTFLVGEHRLDALVGIVRAVHAAPVGEEARAELLAACADTDVVRRFALAADPSDAGALAALEELAALVPGDHLATLLDLFASSLAHRDSRVIRRLLQDQLRGRVGQVTERLRTLDPEVAVALFALIAATDATGAFDAALVLVARAEPSAQAAAVAFLDAAEYGGKVGRALVGALGSESRDVRMQALATLVRRRERRAFDPLLNHARQRAGELTPGEAGAVGEALAALDPERARAAFREWVRPSSLLGRLTPGQSSLRWAAVSGLALLPGGDSEQLLTWLAHHSGDDLGRQCERALARLRGGAGGHGG